MAKIDLCDPKWVDMVFADKNKEFMELKIMANINQSLTLEQIELIAMDYGKEIQEEVEINKEDLDLYFEV